MIKIEIEEKKNALIIVKKKEKGTKIETIIADILTDFIDNVINDIIE